MPFTEVDTFDAAVILAELANALDLLPPDKTSWVNDERRDLGQRCREAAQLVAEHSTRPDLDPTRSFAGAEWRNAILRSVVGLDGAGAILLLRSQRDHHYQLRLGDVIVEDSRHR